MSDLISNEKCEHTDVLNYIHSKIKSERDYWLFTELFCMLHGDSDVCNCKIKQK